jgi:hypothetical protein
MQTSRGRGGDPRLFHLSFLSTIDLKAPRIDFLIAGALDYGAGAPILARRGCGEAAQVVGAISSELSTVQAGSVISRLRP